MAKAYTAKEARQLILTHRDLLSRMTKTAAYGETAAQNIRSAAAALAEHNARGVQIGRASCRERV